MNKILIVVSLILLPTLFGCHQSDVKYVDQLQNDYNMLQSLQASLESNLLHAQDPLTVETYLREVKFRMRLIDNEILKVELMEN
jgi:hypothetical protein